MPVRDIQTIRIQNFGFLLEEVVHELGRVRGAQSSLALRTGVPKSLVSMLANKALHSGTGERRQIGDDTAIKLERGMGKPDGWMDVDRSEARDFRDAKSLDLLRLLTPSQRESVERMMEELARNNRPAPDANTSSDASPT